MMTALSCQETIAVRAGSDAGSRLRRVLLLLFIALALSPRIGFLARPFESDSGLYIYMGKALSEGQRLYVDFFEIKLPGVPLLTSGLYRLFGDQWACYVILQILAMLATAAMLANLVRGRMGADAGTATLLFSLVFLNFSPVAYRGFQLETLLAFFSTATAWLALHSIDEAKAWRAWILALLAGVMAGLGAMIKPTGGAVLGAFALWLIWRRRGRLKLLIPCGMGFCAVVAVVLCWSWRMGLLPRLPMVLREISLYASQTPWTTEDLFKPAFVLLLGSLPFAIVNGLHHRKRGVFAGRPISGELLPFTTAWLLLEVIGVYLQRRAYTYHLLPIIPPLALLFGSMAAGRSPLTFKKLALALAPILVLSVLHSRKDLYRLATDGIAHLPESDYLLAHAAPGDRVVGDGIERLLMETGLRCGSRYAHLFYWANHDQAPLEYGETFLDDLETNRPKWAVFEGTALRHRHRNDQLASLPMLAQRPLRAARCVQMWQKLDDYLLQHYRPEATAGTKTIYRRNDSASP